MPRIPSVDPESPVADRIRARRGGRLRPIDGLLLHSPSAADGWNGLLGALRGELALPAALRELIILRIAVLNDAPYEWDSHVDVARRLGLTPRQLAALRADVPDPERFTPAEQAVLRFAEALTTVAKVDDAAFDDLKEFLNDQQIVEVTLVTAAYNMVSRFANALEIGAGAGARA